MSKTRLAAKALLLSMIAYAPGCADGASDSEAAPEDLLSGTGAEFETAPELAAEAPATDEEFSAEAAYTPGAYDRNGPQRTQSFTMRGRGDWGGGTVYYPTEGTGLASVVMCPGFTARQSSIQAWGPFFASHGIVLMTMDTVSTSDQVARRARGLDQASDALQQAEQLRGRLDPQKRGLAGWSMGGGGTWISTRQNPEKYKSGVTLAGHNATAGGAAVSRGSRVPTIMLNGATDTTILGGMNQTQNSYGAFAAGTPKLMYIMSGEGHFSWGTPRTNGNASGRYVMAWEQKYLVGDSDPALTQLLNTQGPRAATWRVENVR